MIQALLPAYSSMYPSIWIVFVWMSLILQFLSQQILCAVGASRGIRQWLFSANMGCWPWLSWEPNWHPSGVNGTCESNGLIKWDQLDGHSFRMKYKRIWSLCGPGWDIGWQFMVKDGIRRGENVPLSSFSLDLLVLGEKFHLKTDASQYLWRQVRMATKDRVRNGAVHHPPDENVMLMGLHVEGSGLDKLQTHLRHNGLNH